MKSMIKLYRFHSSNLRMVGDGLDHVYSAAKVAIATGRDSQITTYVRLYAFSMGAWTECRLLKLLHEPAAFGPLERRTILQEKALERWLRTVEVAFRKHHGIPRAALVPPALPITAHARMTTLRTILADDLKAVITLRNKLAHGQWAFPLNDDLDDVAQDQMDALRDENMFSLKQKAVMIDSLCGAVHDLVVSKPTFERDFDAHFRHVEQIRVNIQRRSYDLWLKQMRAKYTRGRTKMQIHFTGKPTGADGG